MKRIGSVLLIFLLVGTLIPALAEDVKAQETPMKVNLFISPNPVVEYLPFTATAVVLNGKGPYQFEWSIDGRRASTTSIGILSGNNFGTTGTHSVGVIVTDSNNNQAETQTFFEVESIESEFLELDPVAAASATPLTGDAPLTVTFRGEGIAFKYDEFGKVVSGKIDSYEWDFGDGTISHLQNPIKVYSRHGEYEATLTVVDENGNTDTDTVKIEVTEAGSRREGFNFPPRMRELENQNTEVGKFFSVQATAVDPENDELTFTAVGLPDGFSITDRGLITGVAEEKGDFAVVVNVEDTEGNTDFESFRLIVGEPKKVRGREVVLERFMLTNGEYIPVGDILATASEISNNFEDDLENIRVTVTVPELGLRRSAGPFDVDSNRDELKRIYIELPEDVAPGDYDIRIGISNDDFQRFIHRVFTIIEK